MFNPATAVEFGDKKLLHNAFPKMLYPWEVMVKIKVHIKSPIWLTLLATSISDVSVTCHFDI